MGRLRLYLCPNCSKYGLVPGPKASKKYTCRFCNQSVPSAQVNKKEWEDGDGDVVTTGSINNLDGNMENKLMDTINIQQNAEEIVKLIPAATRSMYPEDDVQAAIKFCAEHEDWFKK